MLFIVSDPHLFAVSFVYLEGNLFGVDKLFVS